jgi:hypothetical protein
VVLAPVRVLTPSYSGPVCRVVHRCFRKVAIPCKRAVGVGGSTPCRSAASKALKERTVASCEACLPWRRWYLTPVFGVGQPDLQAADR